MKSEQIKTTNQLLTDAIIRMKKSRSAWRDAKRAEKEASKKYCDDLKLVERFKVDLNALFDRLEEEELEEEEQSPEMTDEEKDLEMTLARGSVFSR